MNADDRLLLALAERAKKAMYAMRECFRRDPDVADFFSEFKEELVRQEYRPRKKSNKDKPNCH